MADDGMISRIAKAVWPGQPEPEPVDEAPIAKFAPTQTIGSTGVTDYGGFLFDLDRSPRLTGPERWRLYSRMLRDITIVSAGVRLFLNLIANANWQVNPPDAYKDDPRAIEYADLAYDALFDMRVSWATVVRKLAAYKFYGFTLLEWTAKRRPDGAIGFDTMGHRPQRTIAKWLREGDDVTGVVQRTTRGAEVTIPREKLLYAVDDTLTDSPEGLGLFYHIGETADRLRLFLELEEAGFETDLRGIPVARAPLGELKEMVEAEAAKSKEAGDRAKAQREGMLTQLRQFIEKHVRNRKTGLLFPSDTFQAVSPDQTKTPTAVSKWGIDLLNGDSQSFEDIAKSIARMSEEIARVLGCEHLLLGSGGDGSLALSQSKVGTFYLNTTSTLEELVEVVDRDVIETMGDLNGWEEELRPESAVEEISEVDIEMVTRALANMANAGATLLPDDPAIGEVRDRLGLSRPPEDSPYLDASLLPGRNDPPNPDAPMNTDQPVKKRRYIRSRRAQARAMKKRAA